MHPMWVRVIYLIPYSKKTLVVKKLWLIWQITAFHQLFANFHNFHNIPYANGLQFAKGFSAKLPTVLIHQSFLPPKFFTV